MNSMTSFARFEETVENLTVSLEIKGCNSRFLEIFVHMPGHLRGLEKNIREQVAGVCGRGKVDVYINVKERNQKSKVTVNAGIAKSYSEAVTDLCEKLGLVSIGEKNGSEGILPALLPAFLRIEGVLQIENEYADEGVYWEAIGGVLKKALQAFAAERQREGDHTKDDILKSLAAIERSLAEVASFAPVIENTIKQNIRSRFKECLGDSIAETRVLAETAVLLVKYTIAEELSRLSAHLGEFRAQAERGERPGKMLDFLCQEINREINTIGSKSSIIEVSSAVVTMKEALENIREQLKNVE